MKNKRNLKHRYLITVETTSSKRLLAIYQWMSM
jgi:hypothetical protein